MDIRRCELMPPRPCNYGLALQDDSVFADFGLSEKGSLYLVRISYAGLTHVHKLNMPMHSNR